ncbi:hypothetical protein DY000_02015178 [Brassica cretica]|uniref:Uncharacterized protein n=1 Tax=Brassica cretica TaxID=69181 RepID=A0ABQ7CT99_BRACR|nr:hypothetical protein DY000_02015178 [Brassica cretica]
MEEPPSEEVSAVKEGETWMTPLIRYLEADILPEDHSEARKIKKQAARYCISQEKRYRRSFSGPYLRSSRCGEQAPTGCKIAKVRYNPTAGTPCTSKPIIFNTASGS